MEKIEELELFTKELFKRPLVIQPSAHIGRGIAAISCTMFTREGTCKTMSIIVHVYYLF